MYIGNSPATGDNNSFKLLDDISSYTLTFNGSSGSIVSTTNDTITQNNHRFLTGQRVTYTAAGTVIGGLTSGNVYFIIKTDYSTFKLATSYSNAVNSVAIDLTALGTGTHTINVAFDGFNTRFKTTYDNGTRTQISRAAQLQISINGVIQQPNDTSTPTNGFGIDLDSVVVFSAAPSASDVFWGNVLANNFPTFDISDNTIDSFTGNGSQVSFALSKTPANSQNVLVTINGVVQYPTDGSTVRSYSVDGNVLIFTDPPAAASVIQVRHIGFAGPTSSNVTGFYGRTGNVGLTTADAINVGSATIGVGAAGTSLLVQGNARITGILTIGTGSITFDGDANTITGISTISAPSISGVATFSTGPVLIGTGTSTGTAAQRLQVTGGAYVSGNLGVGSTNPQYRLDISGGDLNLPEGNSIRFGGNGRIQVSTGGAQSLSLIQLIPHPTIQPTITELNAGGSEYTLRVAAGVNVRGGMIDFVGGSSTVNPAGCLVFRSGAVFSQGLSPERMRLFSTGEVGIGTTVLSGTSSQLLQVAGGAYVSGNTGIGTTNPTTKLDVFVNGGEGLPSVVTGERMRVISNDIAGRSGYLSVISGSSAYSGIFFGDKDAADIGKIRYYHADNSLQFLVNGTTEAIRVLSNGNIGIGIDNPTAKLQVVGSTDLNKLNLSGISSSISSTAVDVFVYDTRKDSDGGAWRKRTQHTSWYNETLNTATRGSRRDFPAVAVIVATADDVFIYDGDDPDFPLWMKFIGSGGARAVRQGMSSITMLNGLMTAGRSGSERAVGFVNFVSDYVYQIANNGKYEFGTGGILNRNTDGSFINVSSSTQIVNNTVNDVAMTVLPNAPIDAATGLPVPTIAVATAGGTSIIRDDGTVANAGGIITTKISINEKGIVYFASTANGGYYGYSLVSGSLDSFFNTVGNLRILSNVNSNTNNNLVVPNAFNLYSGQTIGLTIINKDFLNTYYDYNGMVAYATTTYNTGWMHGDIKGAWLSDTSTASVTGTELVTNGTFATNTTGWTAANSASVTLSSNRIRVTAGASVNGAAYQQITTVVGQWYTISYDGFPQTANTTFGQLYIRDGSISGTIIIASNNATQTTYSHTFQALSTTTFIVLYGSSTNTNGNYAEWDNISVRLAERDRSVNNKGLQVFGTITKTAVATGSNLVGYGGFNGSTNYLQQPYNSAIEFGTANFSYMGWAKDTTSGGYLFQWDNPNSTNGIRISMFNSTTVRVTVTSVVDRDITYSALTGTWNFFVVQRVGSIIYTYINGVQIDSFSNTTNLSGTDKVLTFGYSGSSTLNLALWRVSATAPSPTQIAKIYNDEKALFQSNSQCTLYGSSDAVTALAYDDTTKLLSVGTSSGRSDFQGLERINNTTTAVTTAISASNGLIAEQ